MAKACVGLEVNVESELKQNLPDTFLIISNHQSLVDIPVLIFAFPKHNVRFVAKRELKYGIPTLSFILRKGKHAFVNRKGSFRANRREILRLARLSNDGVCPSVFPEGTRSRTGKVGPFHSAAVRMILEHTQLPIVSVAVSGGHRIARLKDLIRNPKNCVYRVKFLSLYPPVQTRGKILSILDKCRNEISQQIEVWKIEKK